MRLIRESFALEVIVCTLFDPVMNSINSSDVENLVPHEH